jgi:hypothetical protein
MVAVLPGVPATGAQWKKKKKKKKEKKKKKKKKKSVYDGVDLWLPSSVTP